MIDAVACDWLNIKTIVLSSTIGLFRINQISHLLTISIELLLVESKKNNTKISSTNEEFKCELIWSSITWKHLHSYFNMLSNRPAVYVIHFV